jgi:hypothetical protein
MTLSTGVGYTPSTNVTAPETQIAIEVSGDGITTVSESSWLSAKYIITITRM